MPSDDARCREARRIEAIDAAFRAGDMGALRAAVDDPAVVPHGPMPFAIGPCLVYAVYHSPLPFIRELLALGADPSLRTRIDDCDTAREYADTLGLPNVARMLAEAEDR